MVAKGNKVYNMLLRGKQIKQGENFKYWRGNERWNGENEEDVQNDEDDIFKQRSVCLNEFFYKTCWK